LVKKSKEDDEKKAKEEEGWRLNRLTLDEVRLKVKQRLGVDPYEIAREDRRDRYLRKVCASLPPVGSAEREVLRRGISLAEWSEQMGSGR
jgi:hypothetical protein